MDLSREMMEAFIAWQKSSQLQQYLKKLEKGNGEKAIVTKGFYTLP